MNPIISELAELAMGNVIGPRLSGASSRFESAQINGLTMSLLSWLRDKSRPSVSQSRLNRRVSTDMPEFIQIVPGLAELVTVTNGVLNFSAGVSSREQADIARQAFEMYKPQVSVTYIVQPKT